MVAGATTNERREFRSLHRQDVGLRFARTGKQQSCLKKLYAQKRGSQFLQNLASLIAGEFV
jgi:hypothetical protein